MGFLSGLFRSRDAPRNSTSGSSYRFFMGNSTSGKRVNERSAMQMTAVYSCVRILSEAVAGLPLHLYQYTDKSSKEKAVDNPLYFLLHDEPNTEMTSFVFRETLMTHLLLWGNAYSQIIRNGKGEVMGLYPLMPDRMTVNRDEKGRLYYEYMVSSDDAKTLKDGTVRLSPYDVLHIPGLGFDGLVGYSPIAMAKNAIGLAIAAEEYGSKFYANGATPSGILEYPGTVKEPDKVRESWNAGFGGSSNAHKIAVLEEGMKYTPISISPNEAQFLETRKFQINEIAWIFRVPPHMVGDLEKSSFSNIEQQSLEFVKYTLEPWLVRWEQAMQRSLIPQDDLAFDEVMQILNQHSNFEQLQLRNMPMLSLSGIDIYPDRHKVYRNSNESSLTTKEFEIFYLLVVNKGRVLTYDQIYHNVWNEDTIGNEKNVVKCHIRNIRDKLDVTMPETPFTIKCVREIGYCFICTNFRKIDKVVVWGFYVFQ